MAQTVEVIKPGGLGTADKLKFAIIRLTNTGAETSYVVTAASVGMSEFMVIGVDESAAGGTNIRHSPTLGSGRLFASVALTFTAGDEVTLLCVGV